MDLVVVNVGSFPSAKAASNPSLLHSHADFFCVSRINPSKQRTPRNYKHEKYSQIPTISFQIKKTYSFPKNSQLIILPRNSFSPRIQVDDLFQHHKALSVGSWVEPTNPFEKYAQSSNWMKISLSGWKSFKKIETTPSFAKELCSRL